jgi:phosphoadenosine phosphosulfate reductase
VNPRHYLKVIPPTFNPFGRSGASIMQAEVERIQNLVEHWSPEDLLRWSFAAFQDKIAIASAFGAEGMVLIDIAARVNPQVRLFTLDTEFLFPETYALMERIEQRYGINIERVKPALTAEERELEHGPALWARDPDACCSLRKVAPLRQKLATLRAWITSIRRDQTLSRASARKVEWDAKFHLVKINPIADWTSKQVWRYIHDHEVPYNPLHDEGFPSIGCTHCTRAVRPGEDPRAGRWSGTAKTECGLHILQSEDHPRREA